MIVVNDWGGVRGTRVQSHGKQVFGDNPLKKVKLSHVHCLRDKKTLDMVSFKRLTISLQHEAKTKLMKIL